MHPMQWSLRVADRVEIVPLDYAWLRAHPLPSHGGGTDKNNRGHVVAVGGSRGVPGGLLLTGEAILRAGAGKVQLATIASCAMGLGFLLPEAGVIPLAETAEGDIDPEQILVLTEKLARCDCIVLGPAMALPKHAGALLEVLLTEHLNRQSMVIDAVAIHALRERKKALRAYQGELILTPNPDELASLLECSSEQLSSDPAGCARRAALDYGATIVCKGDESYVASSHGAITHYPGGGVGLATGGSGDILAGLVAGLIARGSRPSTAAAWGVWLHGEAGKALARKLGTIGFLAHELLREVPGLLRLPSSG